MIKPKSISWSLQMWHGVMIVSFLPIFMWIGYNIHKHTLISKADIALHTELNHILSQQLDLKDTVSPAIPQSSDEKHWFVFWDRYSGTRNASPNAPDIALSAASFQEPVLELTNNNRILYYECPDQQHVYAIGMDATELLDELRYQSTFAISAAVIFTIIAIYGGYRNTRQALSPLQEISEKAKLISNGRYDQRLNTEDIQAELVKLCEVLNHAFEHIDHTIDIQRKFTSDASHELRTPISILILELESALRAERTKDEYKERIASSLVAAKKLKKLALSLLEISQLESGDTHFHKESVQLSDCIKSSIDTLLPAYQAKGVELTATHEPVVITADSQRLEQCITNILSNALSHTEDEGTVRLEQQLTDKEVTISISDTGSGIPKSELPYIFDRFYRVDKARTSTQGRSGLGLAICQSIINAHQGSIEAESIEGEGSTFIIRLPRS